MDDKWLSLTANKWSLVIHEVTNTSATLWFGTLYHNLRKPDKVSIIITKNDDTKVKTLTIKKSDWERPFKDITSQRFYKTKDVKKLESGQRYWIKVVEHLRNTATGNLDEILLARGSFWTLPQEVNSIDQGFTVALGSCFFEEYDGGQVSTSYQSLIASDEAPVRPHITFLAGDQVYLDIGLDSLSPIPKEVRDRVADDYASQWRGLRNVLCHGGTWFLADDHEYWNNYPFVEGFNPFIQALRIPKIKKAWKNTAHDGLVNVQRVQPVRTFKIGNDVSFCIADLRSFRTKTRVLPAAEIETICHWVKGLKSPGVLVLSQPIIEKEGSNSDRNFVSYSKDYNVVVKAIHDASHDVLVLSGDIHYGRICNVEFEGRSNRLYEVVSSPMSNLSGVSSVAVARADKINRLKYFPAIDVNGVTKAAINYNAPWSVSTEFKLFDLRYLRERTKEHFMTLRFNKMDSGELTVEVRAWLCREQRSANGLPKEDWKKPVKLILK
ncbi:hypothetical protein SAMN04488136_1222 [Vibrio xiamenensis]|uniref:Alkaline phosphatase D n=1 Tax=Vibrio xiamenensis TaxID=861298 RepID=A0A1G8DWH6_9VIBR|nr:hypothetical protein [Vibrio xiamenensis]SDH62052.1 hypothetical protein SAMN04488136_1222 [Vibrio xiamenensis]